MRPLAALALTLALLAGCAAQRPLPGDPAEQERRAMRDTMVECDLPGHGVVVIRQIDCQRRGGRTGMGE